MSASSVPQSELGLQRGWLVGVFGVVLRCLWTLALLHSLQFIVIFCTEEYTNSWFLMYVMFGICVWPSLESLVIIKDGRFQIPSVENGQCHAFCSIARSSHTPSSHQRWRSRSPLNINQAYCRRVFCLLTIMYVSYVCYDTMDTVHVLAR